MIIVNIKKSVKPNKRFQVVLDNGKTFDFGLKNGNTYLDHHDKIKRNNYWKRHLANAKEKLLFQTLTPSPSLFSLCLLWGLSTDLNENIKTLNDLWKNQIHSGSGNGAIFGKKRKGSVETLQDIQNSYTTLINIRLDRQTRNRINDMIATADYIERYVRQIDGFLNEQDLQTLYNIDDELRRIINNLHHTSAYAIPVANHDEELTFSMPDDEHDLPRANPVGKGLKKKLR